MGIKFGISYAPELHHETLAWCVRQEHLTRRTRFHVKVRIPNLEIHHLIANSRKHNRTIKICFGLWPLTTISNAPDYLYAPGVFSILFVLSAPLALFFLRPDGPDLLALSFILDSGVPGPLAGGIFLDLESSTQG